MINKEKFKAYQKKYSRKNKVKIAKYQKEYQGKKRLNNIALKNFIRICPLCGSEIIYATKYSYKVGTDNNSNCKPCTARLRLGEIHKEIADGVRPPLFYGQHHTEETKQKILNHPNRHTGFKDNSHLRYGKDNHSYGKPHQKHLMELWTTKYGKDEADKRLRELRKKQSENTSGKNNPMYGRPAPLGSGNGWSGWYRGFYFRSLRELACMFIMNRFKFRWRSAEGKDFRIPYNDYAGISKNYYADFIVNDKFLVECKPKKLWESVTILLKKQAGEKFCIQRGLKYKMIDPPMLSTDVLKDLMRTEIISFLPRYEPKVLEYIDKIDQLKNGPKRN